MTPPLPSLPRITRPEEDPWRGQDEEGGSCLSLGLTLNLVKLKEKLHSGDAESGPLRSDHQPCLRTVGVKVKETNCWKKK